MASCTFFMLSCIACACFISPASSFFIMVAISPVRSDRLDRIRLDPGIEARQDVLDERIVAKCRFGARPCGLAPAPFLRREGGIRHLPGLETQPDAAGKRRP